MALPELKPDFLQNESGEGLFRSLFNYRRVWQLTMVILVLTSLGPLLTMAIIDYNVTRRAVESENTQRVERLVSTTKRSLSAFLEARTAALKLLTLDHDYAELTREGSLAGLLEDLKQAFGGFMDLGVIAEDGVQMAYAGPFELAGKDYSDQPWFRELGHKGSYISDVFLGFRGVPHLVVAVRRTRADGFSYVLRATLDTQRFQQLVGELELTMQGDAFLMNAQGVLQTPSKMFGNVLEPVPLPVPPQITAPETFEYASDRFGPLLVGYSYIPDTPFVLMVLKSRSELLAAWYRSRVQMLGLLVSSILVILIIIHALATYLVGRIRLADERRTQALHEVEHASKMASVGRLAAGVAHEINNPLAVINEKAGLIKDLITFRKEYEADPRLLKLVDSIIASVERCGKITKRLLSFARHVEVKIEEVALPEVVEEVLGFLHKEAEYRSIGIQLNTESGLPPIVSDRGKLQQIFLNLVNNAFQAMCDGGRLAIDIRHEADGGIAVSVADDGCGISSQDQKRIYEPFFSTKKGKGGTGLGLSITYGLVQELGGAMELASEVGKGTTFTIHLPKEAPQPQAARKGKADEHAGTAG